MANKDFVVKNGLVTGANNVTFGSAVTFASNGNVGIGTASPSSKLTISGAVSSGDISAGNLSCGTITASGAMSVPSISLTGSLAATSLSVASGAFVANSIGAYHSGTINASSFTVSTFFVANSAGLYSPAVNTTTITSSYFRVGSVFEANNSGVYHTGIVNASSVSIGSSSIVNSSGVYTPTATTNSVILGSYGGTGGSVINTTAIGVGSTGATVLSNSSGIYINGVLALSSSGANNAAYLGGAAASAYARLASPTFTGTVSTADLSVSGNLTVTGTTVTLNTTTLDVKDLNVTLAKGSASAAAANGAGITIEGPGAIWNYNNATNTWYSNIGIASSANNFSLGSSTNLWNIYANTVSAVSLTGNGASVTSVNAATLGGFASNYFVANATYTSQITTINNNFGNYAALSGATFTGDITTYRAAAPTTGVIFLGNTGRYLYFDGSNYVMPSSELYVNGAQVVKNTGTWSINVTGSAGSASSATIATKASTLSQGGGNGTAMTFNWAGQSGQPTWLWGSNDGTNHYVYNPSNFSVNYATTSGVTNQTSWSYLNTTAQLNAQGNQTTTLLTASGSLGGIMVQGAGSSAGAFISFHRPSAFASYFGLDTDNQFTGGGWSYGAAMGNFKMLSLGVGTTASGTSGEIRATNNITAYYSDKRLKENIQLIANPLEKISKISGVTYNSNDIAASFGYTDKTTQVGVLAQEIQEVLPMAVKHAPFDIGLEDGMEFSKSGEHYLTVQYEKIIPLLIEAIKELKSEVETLKSKI